MEEVERRAEELVEETAMLGHETSFHDLVVEFRTSAGRLSLFGFDLFRQQERGDAESPDQGHDEQPAVAPAPADKPGVGPRDADGQSAPFDRGDRHAAFERELVEQRRYEEQRHDQRNDEVDDDYQREIGQVGLLFFGEQPDDPQCSDRGEQRPEDRDEDAPVAIIAVMVDHDDRRVDDNAQRHGDTGQRVDVDVQIQEVVEDDCHEDIDCERDGDDEQVVEIPADEVDEQHQDRYAEKRAEIDFVQFARNVFRCVVGERRGDARREGGLQALHLLFDVFCHPQHIGGGFAADGEGDRVESVDAEIG